MTPRNTTLLIAETIHRAYDVGEDRMEQFPSAYTLAKAIVNALNDNNIVLVDLMGEPVD